MPPARLLVRPDPAGGVLDDFVVGCRAAAGGGPEAVADFHALDGLDAHQGRGQPGVEAAVPVHVAAQSRRQAVGQYLHDAAEGFAFLVRGVHLGHHGVAMFPGRSSAADPRPGPARPRARAAALPSGHGHGGDGHGVADQLDVQGRSAVAEATVPKATRVAVSRALARSRTGRASSKPYFCMPVKSAWPGRGRVSGALRAWSASSSGSTGSADMICSHLGHSVLPDLDGHRAALGQAVADAAEDGDLVLFELHPGAAAVAEPASGQCVLDLRAGEFDSGRYAFDNSHQCRAMGFTGGQPTQHNFHPAMISCRALASGQPHGVTHHIDKGRDPTPDGASRASSAADVKSLTCSTAWYKSISRPGTMVPPRASQTAARPLGQGS